MNLLIYLSLGVLAYMGSLWFVSWRDKIDEEIYFEDYQNALANGYVPHFDLLDEVACLIGCLFCWPILLLFLYLAYRQRVDDHDRFKKTGKSQSPPMHP